MNKKLKESIKLQKNISKHIEEIEIKYASNGYQIKVQIDMQPTFIYYVARDKDELLEILNQLVQNKNG